MHPSSTVHCALIQAVLKSDWKEHSWRPSYIAEYAKLSIIWKLILWWERFKYFAQGKIFLMKESRWKDKVNYLVFREMMLNRNNSQKSWLRTTIVKKAMIHTKKYKKLTKKVDQLKSNKKFWKITIIAIHQVKNCRQDNKYKMMIHPKTIYFD